MTVCPRCHEACDERGCCINADCTGSIDATCPLPDQGLGGPTRMKPVSDDDEDWLGG